MGRALVIKGVNFSTNKLTTVTLLNDKSCYDISLDATSLALQNIGTTRMLTATVLPIDTTDTVTWSSSDSRVASVDQTGVVTVKGAGTATITATCGTQIATCTVTTTVNLSFVKQIGHSIVRNKNTVDAKGAVPVYQERAEMYACGYATTKAKETYFRCYDIANTTNPVNYIYPVYFGCASTLNITAPDNIKVTVVVTDSQHSPANGIDLGSKNLDLARWVLADANDYDSNVPYGNRVVTDIPSDADSVAISYKKESGTFASTDELSGVAIVAS